MAKAICACNSSAHPNACSLQLCGVLDHPTESKAGPKMATRSSSMVPKFLKPHSLGIHALRLKADSTLTRTKLAAGSLASIGNVPGSRIRAHIWDAPGSTSRGSACEAAHLNHAKPVWVESLTRLRTRVSHKYPASLIPACATLCDTCISWTPALDSPSEPVNRILVNFGAFGAFMSGKNNLLPFTTKP